MIRLIKRYFLIKLLQIAVDRHYIKIRNAVYFINDMIYGRLTCEICKREFGKHRHSKKTLDHIFPKSKGGSNDLRNLQLAHRWCNNKKGDSI